MKYIIIVAFVLYLGASKGDVSQSIDLPEVEKFLKTKCEKNGGADAFKNLQNAQTDLQKCVVSNFNFELIQNELDEAKKTGSMDEVFLKYCNKKPIIIECINKAAKTLEACLEEAEKKSLKLITDVIESLIEFACFKDGDRLALFIAEGGFVCLESKKDGLEKCANQTLSKRIPNNISLENVPSFVITKEECTDYLSLQNCMVKELETCEDSTPANIIEALFKFIYKATPCKELVGN